MEAGKLDRRIVIQSNTPAADDAGQLIDSWGTLATVWASISYEAGDEVSEATQRTALQKVVFEIRYNSSVNAQCRVSYGGNTYTIISVQEIGRKWGQRLITELRD